MTGMKATPTKPKEPGFYWLLQDGEDPQVVEIVTEGNALVVYMPGSEDSFDLAETSMFNELTCDWAGPLEPPI